jgi:hypothetical protein
MSHFMSAVQLLLLYNSWHIYMTAPFSLCSRYISEDLFRVPCTKRINVTYGEVVSRLHVIRILTYVTTERMSPKSFQWAEEGSPLCPRANLSVYKSMYRFNVTNIFHGG